MDKGILNNTEGALYSGENNILTINNSIFENIEIKSYVPLIYNKNIQLKCFDNINDLELNMISNKFYKNSAKNGGAIYFGKRKDINISNNNKTINFENNQFIENTASDFGGAIYSKYDELYLGTTKNNVFSHNRAERNSYNENENNNIDYYALGNIGSFINGICELNYFQIYTNPNNYTIIPTIENYNDPIKFNFNNINITINDCNSNQIKMKDKKGIQYCENPLCHESCPVGVTAKCLSLHKENINNINENVCECLPGWKGNNCDHKKFVDFG
ncbi:hypothetical protein PIROE2DRAFT_56958 [Piromyces sp. E2]|nr:hypothetical protein PIROE2DRAFT_56958 [Piromyces sp. E2]|eukprot:OUM70298.1 hypothetical protein PIROE2DRAFT_56958 [Piromyces sp. E2]